MVIKLEPALPRCVFTVGCVVASVQPAVVVLYQARQNKLNYSLVQKKLSAISSFGYSHSPMR